MSARELGVAGDSPCDVNHDGDRGLIPQQLKEVIELVSSVNQRIEDCAVEWQAKISQAQWRILGAKPFDNKPWEQSVLARTYFSDKILDDAFQGLLKHNKNFTDHLQNFIALIRGEQPTMITRQTCNAQNQCSEFYPGNEEVVAHSSSLSPLELSGLERNSNMSHGKMDNIDDNILTKVQKSFTDLIKFKIDFDTKFLGFEATLNGNICATSDPSLGLYQICSTNSGCGTRGKNTKNCRSPQLYKNKARRSSRIKHKRLALRKMTILKMKERKEPIPDDFCLMD